MTSDADEMFDRALGKLRKEFGFAPLTPDEAEAAYEVASAAPVSDAEIDEVVKFATRGTSEPVAAKPSNQRGWSRRFPIKAMKRLRFSLPAAKSEDESLLAFFGVASPEAWQRRWTATSTRVARRQTQAFAANEEAVAAWVREAELVAQELTLADFNEAALRSSLDTLRRLTRKKIGEALDQAQVICARAGVALVVVPELPGTRISGCARWLSETHALIALTIRYKTDDHFWFTFFHEVGHILLHREWQSFVLDNAADTLGDGVVDPEMRKYEDEANDFAAETLIPASALNQFLRAQDFTSKAIHAFAESIGIGPGLVVGRLQHDEFLERHAGNTLKQNLNWDFVPEGGST